MDLSMWCFHCESSCNWQSESALKELVWQAWGSLGSQLTTSAIAESEGNVDLSEPWQDLVSLRLSQVNKYVVPAMDVKTIANGCLEDARVLLTTSPGDAESRAREALQTFRNLGDTHGEATAQTLIAQVLVFRGSWQEAIRPARNALKSLKLANCIDAQETLVSALLGCGETAEARQSTTARLTEFEQQSDRHGQAAMTMLMATISAAEGNPTEAWSTIQEAQGLCDPSDFKLLAKVHLEASSISLQLRMLDETLARAQEALMAFWKLGDRLGEQKANAILSEVYSLRGVPHLAPNRPQAVEAVKEMAKAVGLRDADGYQKASEQLARLAVSNPPISKKEKREVFDEVLRRDQAASDFIRANSSASKVDTTLAGETFRAVEKKGLYFGYRAGGIAYGPRFRGIDMAVGRATAARGIEDEAHAYAVYQLQEEDLDVVFMCSRCWRIIAPIVGLCSDA
eukprot:s945_g1.t1